MWQVLDSPGVAVSDPEILLRKELFGQGLPEGRPDEAKVGYAFYFLENEKEEFITVQMCVSPILTAVTEGQLKKWQGRKILAKPVIFVCCNGGIALQ